jgi:hypothetical protein
VALRMENDGPVVGPDAPTANSKMVKLGRCDRGLDAPSSGCIDSIRIIKTTRTLPNGMGGRCP